MFDGVGNKMKGGEEGESAESKERGALTSIAFKDNHFGLPDVFIGPMGTWNAALSGPGDFDGAWQIRQNLPAKPAHATL